MTTAQPIPTLQPFNGDNIPASLQAHKRWAPWRAVWNEKRGKFDKIPAHAKAPYYGISTARPERWSSYADALKAFQDNPAVFAGVGYVMTGPHDVVGIDLDGCVKDNTIAPWALDVVNRVKGYTEISPSGNGLRILVAGAIEHDWTNHEVGIEVYGGNEPRFLTVTGQRLKLSVLDVTRPDAAVLVQLATQYAKARTTAAVISLQLPDLVDDMLLPGLDSLPLPAGVVKFLTTGDHGGDRSRALFAASVALYSAGLDDDEVFSILVQNPYAFEVALDHRRQDHDRAEMYIWVEHCQKGKAKSSDTLADFQVLTAEDLAAVKPPESGKPLRFAFQAAHEFVKRTPMSWFIKRVLPRAGLCILFGPSASGKTFAVLDMVGAIARGVDWRGHRVNQGRVAYICAEGTGAFRDRIDAYAKHHKVQLTDVPISILGDAPNFREVKDITDLTIALKALGTVDVIVIDTLARVMAGGNENSSEDMGRVIAHCDALHKFTGALVILVTHTGKDVSAGPRGWSGQKGAADVQIEVIRAGKVRKLVIEKMKDGPGEGDEYGFELVDVILGIDEDGDDRVSAALAEATIAPKAKPEPKGKYQVPVLAAMREHIAEHGFGLLAVRLAEMAVEKVSLSPDDKVDARQQNCVRAIKNLQESGHLVQNDEGLLVPG